MARIKNRSPRASIDSSTMVEDFQESSSAAEAVASKATNQPTIIQANGLNDKNGASDTPETSARDQESAEELVDDNTTPNASKSSRTLEKDEVTNQSASPSLKPGQANGDKIVNVHPASPRPVSKEFVSEEKDFAQDKARLSVEEGSSLSTSITSFQSGSSPDVYCQSYMLNEECRDSNCVYHHAPLDEDGVESPRRLSWLPPSRPRSFGLYNADPASFKRQSSMSSNAPAFDPYSHNYYPRGMALSRQSSIRSTGTFASIGTMPARQSFDFKHYGDSEHSFRSFPDGSIMRVMPNQQLLRHSSTMSSVQSSMYGDFMAQRAPPSYTDVQVYLQSSASPTHPPSEASSVPEAEVDGQRPNLRRKSHFENGTLSSNANSEIPSRHPSWKPGGESAFSVKQLRRHSSAATETPQRVTPTSNPNGQTTNRRRRVWPPSLEDTEAQSTQSASRSSNTEARPKEQNLGSVAEDGTKGHEAAKRLSLGRSISHSPTQPTNNKRSAISAGFVYPHFDPNPSQSFKLPLPGEPIDDDDFNPDASILKGKSAKAKAYSKLFRDMTADYMEMIAERDNRISERDHIILALRLEVNTLKHQLAQASAQEKQAPSRQTSERATFQFPPLTLKNVSVLKVSLRRRAEKLKKQSQEAFRFNSASSIHKSRLPLQVATSSGIHATSHSSEASPVTVKMSRSQNSSLDNLEEPLPRSARVVHSTETSPATIRKNSYSLMTNGSNGSGSSIAGSSASGNSVGAHSKSRSFGEYELLSNSSRPLARLERQNKFVLERLKRAEADGVSQADITAELLDKLENLDLEREKGGGSSSSGGKRS